MASTTRKKSASSTTAKKSGGSRGKKTAPPPKRPIRREVWGGLLLVLALCVTVSYCGIRAIFIDWCALLLKGLFGYGYWLAGPALLLAGLILLFHHGRPVRLRVTCALLLPVLFGALLHMVLVSKTYTPGVAILKVLWQDGVALQSGGAISGALAGGFVAVFSKVVSIIVFTALLVVLLVVALRLTLASLIERHRNRPVYEEEPEEPAIRVVPLEAPHRKSGARHAIDIPLDDTPASAPAASVGPNAPGRPAGFFRRRSEQQRTPAQVLTEGDVPTAAPSPAPAAPVDPEPPVSRPAPVPEPAAARETVPADPPGKKAVAKEVAAATAAVTAEIEGKLAAGEETYQFPPITLLRQGGGEDHIETGAELRNNSRRLAETLTSFGVDATAGDVVHGPSVTRYEFMLDQGVKLSKITNLADDIALALGASGVRIAPIPDKISVVGIEVPNKQVTPVLIRDVIESRSSRRTVPTWHSLWAKTSAAGASWEISAGCPMC